MKETTNEKQNSQATDGRRSLQPVVRPCGHCGRSPRRFGNKVNGYYVGCLAADCRQPVTCCHKTLQGAIDEWNEETV